MAATSSAVNHQVVVNHQEICKPSGDFMRIRKICDAFEERFADFKYLETGLLFSITFFLSMLKRCHKNIRWN